MGRHAGNLDCGRPKSRMRSIGFSATEAQRNTIRVMLHPRTRQCSLIKAGSWGWALAAITITMVSCTTIECACIEDVLRRAHCEVDVDRAKRRGDPIRTDCVSAGDENGTTTRCALRGHIGHQTSWRDARTASLNYSGSSGNRVGSFQGFWSARSMHLSTFERRYSSSRSPYARRWMRRFVLLSPSTKASETLFSGSP